MTAFLYIPPRGRYFEDGPADIGLLGPGLTSLLALCIGRARCLRVPGNLERLRRAAGRDAGAGGGHVDVFCGGLDGALAGPLATWPTVAGDICLAGSFAMWMRGLRNELLWVLGVQLLLSLLMCGAAVRVWAARDLNELTTSD